MIANSKVSQLEKTSQFETVYSKSLMDARAQLATKFCFLSDNAMKQFPFLLLPHLNPTLESFD